MGAAAEIVGNGTCMIGLLPMMFIDMAVLWRFPLTTIELVPVVAAGPALAAIDGVIDTMELHEHVQLVLTDHSSGTAGRDFGVLSGRAWRIADLGAKHAMLLAGLGWGNMPEHMIAEDVARGCLMVTKPAEWNPESARVVMSGACRAERTLGPAGAWMVEHLSEGCRNPSPSPA